MLEGKKVKEDWLLDLLEDIYLGYSGFPEPRIVGTAGYLERTST